MATKKSTIILASILSVVVGYALGLFIGIPSINSDRISGDIGKVNRHKTNVVSESEALLEQKLRTDTAFMAQTAYFLSFISSRIGEFKENAAFTASIVADYPQTLSYQQSMTDLAAIAANAQQSASSALVALEKITQGEEVASYEEFSNNALLSYLLLGEGLAVSKDFVADVDAFLQGKKPGDHAALSFARDLWANYNLVEAVLNEDNTLMAYWLKAGNKLTVEQSKLALGNASAALQNTVSIASLFNAQLLANVSNTLNGRAFTSNPMKPALFNFANRLGVVSNNAQSGRLIIPKNTGALELVQTETLGAMIGDVVFNFPEDLHAKVSVFIFAGATLNANASANFLGALSKKNLFGVSSKFSDILKFI